MMEQQAAELIDAVRALHWTLKLIFWWMCAATGLVIGLRLRDLIAKTDPR